jgi:hypothetical protein
MPTVHAKDFSASASARWLTCPASVIETRKYQSTTSSAAEEGTCAHELGEIGLRDNLTQEQLSEYIGKTLTDAPTVEVDKEMVEYVWGYIEYCRSFTGDMFVEIQVDYSPWAENGFGTSDCIIIGENRGAVIDLKYGKGIEVSAVDNSQAKLYALGTFNEYDFLYEFDKDYVFELHIYQPRISNYSTWEITVGELLEFGEEVKRKVAESMCDSPVYNPTEKGCLWCAHKANCVALQKHTEEVIGAMFEDLSLPSPETVDVQNVLKNKSLIESWLKAVEGVVFERLCNGEQVEGFKLVAGRSVRKWVDEKQAIEELSATQDEGKIFTKKFITLPQAEKLIGKADFNKEFGHLVIKPEGKPTLAPSSDKRSSITDVTEEFDKL